MATPPTVVYHQVNWGPTAHIIFGIAAIVLFILAAVAFYVTAPILAGGVLLSAGAACLTVTVLV